MKIFVAKEDEKIDLRTAIDSVVSNKLQSIGHEVIRDQNQIAAADIVVSVNPLSSKTIMSMKDGAISVSIQKPHLNEENLKLFSQKSITAFALDLVPRTTKAQYMDVLSSQSSLAGYRSVIEAAHILNRAFPLMMTTAGTIPAAKVLVVGAGVAGLQSIATAKRLGAIVNAFDVRASAKEQVESLGAKFVEVIVDEDEEKMDGVYAKETSLKYKERQEEKIRSIIATQDVVITTAQIPFRKAPLIIKKDMLDIMKSGSIIIDLASETGGNCELTKHGETVVYNDVKVISFINILNGIHHDASMLFAKNVFAFIELLLKNPEDETIKAMTLVKEGKIFWNKRGE